MNKEKALKIGKILLRVAALGLIIYLFQLK